MGVVVFPKPPCFDTIAGGLRSGSVDSGGGGLGCLAGWRRVCNVNGRAGRLNGLVDGVDNGLHDYVDILDLCTEFHQHNSSI
jgi:hypothetical protein